MKRRLILTAAIFGLSQPAWADNVAHCEALIMEAIASEDGQGEARIASYRPAVGFLASLYDEEDGHLAEIDGFPIRAIMCRRNDVIPSKADYPILATGVPFVLSQNFDSSDTDSLTVYWKEDALDYVYKGHPLSEEAREILEGRLAKFSAAGRTHPPQDRNAEDRNAEDLNAENETAEREAAALRETESENIYEAPPNADSVASSASIAVNEGVKMIISDHPIIAEDNQE